ncbi:uncharacterized protein K452DRAFT_282729 [Aplosporella prunicola CBS 121167]|uniref:Uncharacterized protein n=1 Tax=Aplosporella prunicola CBS 121167 TaxID=1176127 RepID=A0A6A6BTI2_9PEZI|nr:uncharacterized protein K452DRAFT_282729 [Aplosporella prunicola CBS 121167]KAF2146554.1 hypothetical protein K452DRAFT_282729 [Aplosporella prunicola CBS 121167]
MKVLLFAFSLLAMGSALPFGGGNHPGMAGHRPNGTSGHGMPPSNMPHPPFMTPGAPLPPFMTPGGFAKPTPLAFGPSVGLTTPGAQPTNDAMAISYIRRDGDDDASELASSIETIASGTKSCSSATQFANECRTASQAAPHILTSFEKYSITNANVKAAVLSLMLYESGEFKYNWGHFLAGGVSHTPGKGTRNMQSAAYNEEYARSLFNANKVDTAKSVEGADGVLKLVSEDQYSFASAAWFLATQCDASVRQGLQDGTQQGFEQYVSGCIGGTMDQSRLDYWNAAKSALSG